MFNGIHCLVSALDLKPKTSLLVFHLLVVQITTHEGEGGK